MGRDILSRPASPPDRVIAYGSEPAQVIDVWGSAGPLVVFLHGGFWRAEWDRTHVGPLAVDLAARGYRVAVPEYRRTGQPGGGWPGTFDDVLAAVAAIPGGTPILAGHSAGGHLALWAATRIPARGVVALAPVSNLTEAYRLDLDRGAVAALLGGSPAQEPERYAAADPALLDLPPVPVTLVHGTADAQVPVEMSRAYAARGPRLVELPGVDHFALVDPLDAAFTTVVDTITTLGAEG